MNWVKAFFLASIFITTSGYGFHDRSVEDDLIEKVGTMVAITIVYDAQCTGHKHYNRIKQALPKSALFVQVSEQAQHMDDHANRLFREGRFKTIQYVGEPEVVNGQLVFDCDAYAGSIFNMWSLQ